MNEKNIGRLISIDNYRVLIELESDLKGLYKNNYEDLYEIAKINSYIIIPVNQDRIVALVTRVKVNDETEFDSFAGNITLPKSKRYIYATMTGTITIKNEKYFYLQGVYNFPILDNPVWHVTNEELKIIFDYASSEKIDYVDDFYLPIGRSPVFNDFEVKINPDSFFCKHAAILGNTGSGKSCTVSTILQSLLTHNFGTEEEKYLENANIIIFDTNGEYKRAFDFEDEKLKNRINAFTICNDGVKVPFWFMNYEDFDYLFKPSANTQAPILKRAIEFARDFEESEINSTLSNMDVELLILIKSLAESPSKIKELFGVLFRYEKAIIRIQNRLNLKIIEIQIKDYICFRDGWYNEKKTIESEEIEKIIKNCSIIIDKFVQQEGADEIKQAKNIDLPLAFDFEKLINECIDKAIEEQNTSNSKLAEFLSTLRLRLKGFYADERFNRPFMLKEKGNNNLLTYFIQYIMGVLSNQDKNVFTKYKFSNTTEGLSEIKAENNKNQITIIDMSLLPYEVLENITGLIARIILEFLSRLDKIGIERGKYPTVLVLEEAQNYIPEKDREPERVSVSKRIFERIAREGRKYGLSLIVSSQRPSELSKTVLSQCNTFIVHRLQNPEDQRYIRQIVSSANEDILSQLPILPQQHAIIMGEAVRSPLQLRLRDVEPSPKSNNPKFVENWLKGDRLCPVTIDKVIEHWIGKSSTKNNTGEEL